MITRNLIIVMGVSGCGKSTLAQLIAQHLGYQYIEADDFHSASAKAQMAQNIPLTDDIRQPWLLRICDQLVQWAQKNEDVVLAYSGLKAKHRHMLRIPGYKTHFILLEMEPHLIAARLEKRTGHFANAGLLESQLNSMESPSVDESDITLLNANQKPADLLTQACLLISKNNPKVLT